MPLDSAELADLKSRCLFAHAHGYDVARSEHYVATLAEEAGDDAAGTAPVSPALLLALINQVEKVRSGETPKAKKAEPVVEVPKAKRASKAKAEKIEVKAEPKVEVEPKPEVTETHDSLDVFEAIVAESGKVES
jgi:hypothetical protein